MVLGNPMKVNKVYKDHEYWVAKLVEFAIDEQGQVSKITVMNCTQVLMLHSGMGISRIFLFW